MGAERWLQFKSPKETKLAKAYLAPLGNKIGIDDKWGCWLEWKGATRLEICFNFSSSRSGIDAFIQREICQRFDVRRIGAGSAGWYPESDWQSKHPRGIKALHPEHSNWIEWAKAYKPEWSSWLPKRQHYIGEEEIFNNIMAEDMADLREVEAFVVAKFEELDLQCDEG